MNDRVKEALLVLEHHRALFRLKHAKTEGERYRYLQEVRMAEENLKAYEEGFYDTRVQSNEKTNSQRGIPSLRFVRRENHESR